MPEYAPPPATISGQQITVDRLINSPILIYRLLRTLVQQRLVGDKLLAGRVDLTGSGTAVYEIAESIFTNMSDEVVGQLAEYPLSTDAPGTIAKADTVKRGLATEISDELIARARTQGPDPVVRKITKLANRIAFSFDALCLSAISSAVTQTQAATAAWNTTGADPLADMLLAAAQVDELNQGYVVDTAVTTPTAWARVISNSKVLANTPRESDPVVVTGNLVQIAGLNIWKIQARKVAVPMVQEPGAAVKITGV